MSAPLVQCIGCLGRCVIWWLDQLYLKLWRKVNPHAVHKNCRNAQARGNRVRGNPSLETTSKAHAIGHVGVLAAVASHDEHRLGETVSENSNDDCVLKCANREAQAQAIPRHLIFDSVRCVVVVSLDAEKICKI